MLPCRLILFTRYPIRGFAKTRLIPALGEEGAADLQRAMTQHTVNRIRPLIKEGVRVEVRHEGGDPSSMARWLGDDLSYKPQGEGSLGVRMESAFRDSLDQGEDRAVIIGTDCPDVTAQDVREAFNLLSSNPVVLGPASDGGYYLIGISTRMLGQLQEPLFSGIPWGTDGVYSNTVNALANAGIELGLLDEKADVDEPKDLVHWERVISAEGGGRRAEEKRDIIRSKTWASIPSTATISVIIPTLNEESNIRQAIERLKGSGTEIVVADGGSTDKTADICRGAGVEFLPSTVGRGAQMNAGAKAASGQILLFLHADTILPDGFVEMVRGAVASGRAAGAFSFGTDLDTPSMRVITWAAGVRAKLLGIVFGDQAIFTRADVFRTTGGFPDLPLMEDMELVRLLKKHGRFVILKQKAVSSARKWRSRGVWRTTLVNQAVMWLYLLGVGPEKLGKWYQGKMGG